MLKKFFKMFSILLLVGFAAGLAAPGSGLAAEPLKLGFAGPLSGELESYGISGLRGVELAVREINAKGGVHGYPVVLMVEDDLCKPRDAGIIAARLATHGVHAVVGHVCSGATRAALDIYGDARIIVVSPSATNPDLTRIGDHPNFFRTIASDDAQAAVQVDFAVDVLKAEKIAVLHDKGVYGKGLAEFVKAILKKSGRAQLVLYQGFAPGAIDSLSMAQKIRRSRAGVVIFGGYHPQAAWIVRQMRKMKMKTVFFSGDGVKDEAFIASAEKYAEGVYATAPKDTSSIPLAMEAARAHQEIYGAAPGPFFLNAYAATLALGEAFERAGSKDCGAVSKVLKTATFNTPLGDIRFDERGDAVGAGVGFSVYQVQNGRFVEVK